MWHWTTRTGEFPEAVAFTRRAAEPEPAITETRAGAEQAEITDSEHADGGVDLMCYELAG
ncbi:hypothetical protein [Nocardia sp. X0981]